MKLRKNAASRRMSTEHPQCREPAPSRERYFTDGSNLYRFVEWLTPSGQAKLAAFEDCRTLALLLVSGDYLTNDLSNARLRRVS